jgi:UDP-GlcNAc:undecaprenyl-phosphate/decaprenyl-phosphate GlcNAc-1-phosphate transferase
MQTQYIFYYLTFIICLFGFFLSNFFTKWILSQSTNWMVLDDPKLHSGRKFQTTPIPLLGGLGFIFVSGLMTLLVWFFQKVNFLGLQDLLAQNLEHPFKMVWIALGGFILTLGGILDDKFTFSTKWLFLFVFVGLTIAVFGGGLSIDSLSFPFDKVLPNNPIVGPILAFVWIGLCVCATKFLDGHDGLVGSVGILNLIVIAIVASFSNINQPLITLLALVWAAGILGFLPFNLPNAKIYLGESASEMIGFVIGVLSILSGGWFIFDLLLVIYLRKSGGKSIFTGGREHWHFRLLDIGFNKSQVLWITILILLISSIFSLLLPTAYKLFSILGQFAVLLIIFAFTQNKFYKLKEAEKLVKKNSTIATISSTAPISKKLG